MWPGCLSRALGFGRRVRAWAATKCCLQTPAGRDRERSQRTSAKARKRSGPSSHRALAERSIAPQDALPRDLHRVNVTLGRVADLSRESARRALGLPRIRPTSTQWPTFQAIGEALADAGAQGILYSSSARARSRCLCVFEVGLAGLKVDGEPIRVIAPPPLPRGMRT